MGWSCLPDSAAAAASGSFVKSATADVGFLMKSSCLNGTKQMFFMLSSVPIFFAEADSASLVETVISTGLALRNCHCHGGVGYAAGELCQRISRAWGNYKQVEHFFRTYRLCLWYGVDNASSANVFGGHDVFLGCAEAGVK